MTTRCVYFSGVGPGQKYIQVWHGTPLKKIANDVPPGNLSLVYRDLMKREANYWDVFIAQTHWAAEVMKKAFGYCGETIVEGYPRNVSLFGDEAIRSRQTTREFLDIDQTQKVVLYAPTWRDSVKAKNGAYDKVTYLDLKLIQKQFGDQVVVLLRGHSNTVRSGKSITGPNVIDVSAYPNVNDLINASDLMIGDYSSIMFDYINTGKPIIFLTPDLAEYRDVTRGFYFDFESAAPGPLCSNTVEVNKWLSDLSRLKIEFGEKYNEFRQNYAGLDDIDAAKRVVERIFN